jgi:hypothetical protein
MFPIIEKTLSTGADVPGKGITNSTILEILLAPVIKFSNPGQH